MDGNGFAEGRQRIAKTVTKQRGGLRRKQRSLWRSSGPSMMRRNRQERYFFCTPFVPLVRFSATSIMLGRCHLLGKIDASTQFDYDEGPDH